jgi:hypothetical protein
MSPTTPAIGAPIAVASTTASKNLLPIIDECLLDSNRFTARQRKSAHAHLPMLPEPSLFQSSVFVMSLL